MTQSKIIEIAPLSQEERERMFDKIYKDAPSDYKGTFVSDGHRYVMSWAQYGTGLSSSISMSDEELRERCAYIQKRGKNTA
jgi:hypothetical protein